MAFLIGESFLSESLIYKLLCWWELILSFEVPAFVQAVSKDDLPDGSVQKKPSGASGYHTPYLELWQKNWPAVFPSASSLLC